MTLAHDTTAEALAYAAQGWQVWPIRPRTRLPLAMADGHMVAPSSDPDVVADWWRRWPTANIGAVVPDGLVVVDIDPRNRPADDLGPGRFPATLTCRTGGDGWHLWFRRPWVDLRKASPELPGVDLLVGGTGSGRVTLPPSLHRSGKRYTWTRVCPPAPLPAWLVSAFERPPVARRAQRDEVRCDRYTEAAIRGVLADLAAAAAPGNHHGPLLRAAYRFHDLGVSEDHAVDQLLVLVPGHDPREGVRTIRSAYR